jgi:hypothetical protein
MTRAADFGATGDGRTDDTEAIQRAVAEGDGMLVFDRGDYVISRPIVVELAESGRLGMTGGGVATLVMTGAGPALDIIGTHRGSASPDSFEEGVMEGQRMPTISGLEVLGAHEQADGIRLSYTHAATLTGLQIRECRHAVHLVERDRNLIIADCHIYHNRGVGVFYDGVNIHQSNITGSHISYNMGGGIKLLDAEVRNIQFTGNDIEYNYDLEADASADVWIDCRSSSIREGAITGNTIQASASPGGANVRIIGARADRPTAAGNLTVSGNLISSQETNVHIADSRGVVVSGNHFFSGHRHAVHIERSEFINLAGNNFGNNPDYKAETRDGIVIEDSNGCSITGCIIENCAAEAGAVDVRRSRSLIISACQVHDPRTRAIHLADVRRAVISSCIVSVNEDESTLRESVRLSGECTEVELAANLLMEGPEGAVVRA